MEFFEYSAILFSFLILISSLIFLYKYQNKNPFIPTNWPFLGMIPAVLVNSHRLHDLATDILVQCGGTFMWKGPWFSNIDMLFTTHPTDVHHILSKNFPNYPKGDEFRKIFDILGEGIFTIDGEIWEFHRRIIMSLLNHHSFQSLLETIIWHKVKKGLLPILEHVCEQGVEMDFQEINQRFTFDTICKLILDYDPESMSLDFPYVPSEKAMSEFGEAILHRHIMPPCFWKLQQLLRIGNEKKLSDAWKTLDQFIYKCLADKQKELSNMKDEQQVKKFGLLTTLIGEFKNLNGTSGDPSKVLRDTLLNLMVAGRDSTSSALSWFFYLLAKNCIVENKILEEIHTQLKVKTGEKWKDFSAKELDKLVYLHAALLEALRLYPPISFNHKTPLQPDILPSGHQVDQNTRIILSFYTMGRMKSIWGEDCMEFKPERWFSEGEGIKHQPFYKFTAFNAGPRTCVGKHMTLSQMKILAGTIIYHYHIELVEGHPVCPSGSIVLQMKHGLKVTLTKRNEVKI